MEFMFMLMFSIFSVFIYDVRSLLRLPENVTIPAVFTFGDSIADTGNNNYFDTFVKSDFPPYGKDFPGGEATGRFSNGKVPPDLFVESLGIKELLPPYLDPNLQMDDLLTGVNFASGGSGYDPLTSEFMSVLSLEDQLNMFKNYTQRIKGSIGEANATRLIKNSLFLAAAGTDDLANNYFSTFERRFQYSIETYTDLLITASSNFVQELYDMGARKIAMVGVPPVGCLPSQRTLAGGIMRECAEDLNQAAQMLNAKILAQTTSLNTLLQGVKVVYADIYNPLLNLIQNPQTSGFRVTERGCCGTGMLEVGILCNRLDIWTCIDSMEYVFWDSYHPTEKAYRIFLDHLSQPLLDSFFSH